MARRRILLYGWVSQVQVHLSRWARGLKGRGYEVKVVALGGTPISDIETVNLPRKGKLSYLRQVRAAIAEAHVFKPDIVHAHYATGYGYWANRTGLHPTVVSVYGSDLIEFPTNWVKRQLVRRVLTKATHVTATSRWLGEAAIEIAPASKNKITVVPFGVDMPDSVVPEPAPGPIRVCFIKHHNHRYGPDVLLEAMAKVKQIEPNIKLSMAGTGELNELLKNMASRLGLGDTVTFTGLVPHREMYSFIQRHHFMVMPSRRESFGVAVLEASACGRPVIATRVGGVPEVLVDNQTGILVRENDAGSLAEAIINLAGDSELRNRMGRAGREFVRENYTWDKSLDLMTDLYERLLHEKK